MRIKEKVPEEEGLVREVRECSRFSGEQMHLYEFSPGSRGSHPNEVVRVEGQEQETIYSDLNNIDIGIS